MGRVAHKQDSALHAIEKTTKPIARYESGCHPSKVEIGAGIKCSVVPYVSKTPSYREKFADHAAIKMLVGLLNVLSLRDPKR